MRLKAQQARRIWKHRLRVRLCKTFAAQNIKKQLRMMPPHVGVALALGRPIAEMAPAIDHLFGRASADPELETPAGDQIGGTSVLGHIERVLVAHVDHGRADLDLLGPGADRRQQRKR
jgi:hypothetical protein